MAKTIDMERKNNMKNDITLKTIAKFNLAYKVLGVLFGLLCFVGVSANSPTKPELGQWSALFFRGNTATQVYGDILQGQYNSFGEEIYALELAYTLDKDNLIRRFFNPIFDVVQVAGNVAYRHDYTNHDNVKEGNLYMVWRFSRFPWNNYIKNSIAIGDGFSYASKPPFADIEPDKPRDDYSKLLNYLLAEFTFALPSHPEFELAIRLHHRCTAWGTFPKKANAGSTAVGIGLRYYF